MERGLTALPATPATVAVYLAALARRLHGTVPAQKAPVRSEDLAALVGTLGVRLVAGHS